MCLAEAHAGAARFGEVEAVLAPFEEEASAAPPDVAAAYVLMRLRALLRGPGDQPDRAPRVLGRFEGWHDDADWRALTVTVAAWMAMNELAFEEVDALVAPSLADPSVSIERRLHLLMVAARSTARRGRVDDYDAIVAEVERLSEQLESDPFDLAIRVTRKEAARITAARDLPGVRGRTLRRLEQANRRGDPYEYVALVYNLAHIEAMQGHHAEARDAFQRAADHLSPADAFNLGPITDVMLAITLAYLGEEEEARHALDRTDASIARMPYLVRAIAPDRDRAEAMLEMAAGRVSAAREMLLVTATTAARDVLVASESLHVAMLLGADAAYCAGELERLAHGAQDDVIHAWARHARAVADRDPAAQFAAAEAFEELSLDLDAAQAAALAAASFHDAGLRDSSNRASALAAACAARCPGVRVPALALRPDAPELTAREREIAGLAARGLSNPEIAQALVLSIRTVETYILRASHKLGVHNRVDLAKVLAE
jgi:DNA-binding NarL/FixJ family response regulator